MPSWAERAATLHHDLWADLGLQPYQEEILEARIMANGVTVRCPKVGCGKLTGWRYPSFAWAQSHVRGFPPRTLIFDGRADVASALTDPSKLCPRPLDHANEFLAARGLPPLALTELLSSPDPEAPSPEDDDDSDPPPPYYGGHARVFLGFDERGRPVMLDTWGGLPAEE